MISPTKLTLTQPVMIDGVAHTSISIRPPLPRDIAIVNRTFFSQPGRGKALILRVTGISDSLLMALGENDMQQIEDYLSLCLPE